MWFGFRCLVSVIAMVALIVGAVVALRPRTQPPRSDEAAIDAIMRQALRTWSVPGAALAVVRDDRVIFVKGFGVRELGRTKAVTPDTVFPLASCTKAFTTTAMAMLVDEGKMQWDDPVRKHVPYFHLSDPGADAAVTLRDLVSHRTGVGANDLLWYGALFSREETIRRIGKVPLKFPFRSAFQYQTTMFTTAGQAVALTSGTKWEEFVRARILEPLGMKNCSFTTTAALKADDHASPHRKDMRGTIQVIPWYKIEQPEPAGSLNASIRDLASWVRFHLGNGTHEGKRLVSSDNLAETHRPQTIIPLKGEARDMNPDTHLMCYGMAWVLQDYRGYGLVSHAGIIDGFRAHITLVPEARFGLALLNNLDRTSMNLAVSNTIIDYLLGLPAKDWNRFLSEQIRKSEEASQARARQLESERPLGTRPSRELAAFAGKYENAAYGAAEVNLQSGALTWKWSSFIGPLEHYQYDTFMLANERLGRLLVTFTLGTNGEVDSMKVAEPMSVEFKRISSNSRQ